MKDIRIKRFKKSLTINGSAEYERASRFLTQIYKTRSRKRSHFLYRKYLFFLGIAAHLGHPEAQNDMGMSYYDMNVLEFNNPDEDEERQLFWFKKACDNDVPDACNALAIIYERRGLIDEAVETYKKAIALGDDLAAGNMATMKIPQNNT